MNDYDKLRLESRTLHDKMQLLIDLQTDITDFEYTKANEKYMIRNKDNKVEQLKKAHHVLSMWIEEAEKQQ